MAFKYATHEDHVLEHKLISKRLSCAKTVAGTQKLHCIIPVTNTSVNVSEFSFSQRFRKEQVVFEKNASYDAPLSGYLTAKYDNQWWLGYIIEAFDYTQEVKLRFLHPAGPSASIFYPNLEDSCIIHKSDLLLSVKPKTIT